MFAGSKLTLIWLGDFSSSRVCLRSRSADSWPVSKARVTPFSAGHPAGLGQGVEHATSRPGSSTSGRNPAWRVRSARPIATVRSSAQASRVEALTTGCGVAEAACGLDGLGRGVVLAGKAEHGTGEDQAGADERPRARASPSDQLAWWGSPQAIWVAWTSRSASNRFNSSTLGHLEAPGADAEGHRGDGDG